MQPASTPHDADSTDQNEQPPVQSKVPVHVAIIMDGNGRWASGQGRPRSSGHKAGTDNIRRIITKFTELGVKYLTLFAFSTENWKRPEDEVQTLIEILRDTIYREVDELHEQGVKIRHIGRLDRLSPSLKSAILGSVERTCENTGLTLNVAFDYGGRDEIIDAIKRMVADNIPVEDISEENFGRYLYTHGLPDPDLIIRTAGEMRVSNFLLWQSAYAEYYTTSVLWPDFDEQEVVEAVNEFGKRSRKFGKVITESVSP